MSNKLPNIAVVGNAPDDKCELLNAILGEEELPELCSVTLYGADGQTERQALLDAVEDWRNGTVQGIVCLPFATDIKEVLKEALGDGAEQMSGLYVNDRMRMTSVMGDMAEMEAVGQVTKEAISACVRQVAGVLKRDFLLSNPRVAVTSANEVKAEVGEQEQKDMTTEAVEELSKEGILAFGPVDGKAMFDSVEWQAYDVLVAIYDAQCMTEMVKSADNAPVEMVTGLDAPVVLAQYETVLKAIFMVLDMTRNRKMYDEPFANPLQKLYKERREDGDKARFAVKRKGFNPAEHRRENVNYTTIATPKPSTEA